MLKKVYKTLRRYVPLFSLCVFVLGAVAGILQLIIADSPSFAEMYNRTVAAFFRAAFAYGTNWIPFSLAETAVLFLPVLVTALLIGCIRAAKTDLARAIRYITGILSGAVLLYITFVVTLCPGYHAAPIEEKLHLEREPVSKEQLAYTALALTEQASAELDGVLFRYGNASVMPYTYDELSQKLMEAYDRVTEEYPFIDSFPSRVKPFTTSPLVTYTHISGIYSVFTGEANINVHYPDYVIPFTAAHELAHQRGISREDEANFVAFLVCEASDDPYIRYSGYQNMYEYVSSALYSADREWYYSVLGTVDDRIRQEMIAYSEFFEPYRKTVVSEVSDSVNNAYLTLQGTEGVKSYGMVVDLAVAYMEKQ